MTASALAVVRTFTAVRTPPFKSQFPDLYSPGRFRAESDAEGVALTTFLARHPEYAALAPEVIAQAMNYRQRRGRHQAEIRYDAGVPDNWASLRSDDCGPSLAEER